MAAARCPDCGAVTVKDRAGLWVLRHKPGCEELDGPATSSEGRANREHLSSAEAAGPPDPGKSIRTDPRNGAPTALYREHERRFGAGGAA